MTDQPKDLETQLIQNKDKNYDPPDCDLTFVFKIDEKYKQEQLKEELINQIKKDVFKIKKLQSVDQNKWEVWQQFQENFMNILKEKCKLDVEKHITDEHVFLKINAKEEVLEEEAHRISYKLRMLNEVDNGGMAQNCPPYAKVDKQFYIDKDKKKLFQVYENGRTHFRQVDRVRLITSLVGRYVIIPQAAKHELFTSFVPKDLEKEKQLASQILTWNPFKSQPVEEIRNYFGEQVALYFSWVDHLYKYLLFPAVLGLIATILMSYYDGLPISQQRKITDTTPQDEKAIIIDNKRNANIIALVFSSLVAIWSICFLEFWKRKQAHLSMDWGMDDFEEEEQPRPEFYGELVRSPVNGKYEKAFPKGKRKVRQVIGLILAFTFVFVTIGIVGAIFFYRSQLSLSQALSESEKKNVPLFAAFANAMQIKVMNFVYEKVAVCANDWENHQTQTEYEDALYGKIFAFQFVNSFVALYYMAFLKQSWEGCKMDSCTAELGFQLFILFATFIGMNAVEIGIPFIKKWRSERQQKDNVDQLETEADMGDTEVQGDYQELMICFGYLTLFASSLPIAPLLALLAVGIEIKVDGYKYLRLVKRTYPDGAADIGIWQSILHFMAIAAVVTNIALIMLTDNKFEFSNDTSGKETQWGLFVVVEHFVLLLIYVVEEAVPDEPDEVADMKKRHKYLINEKYLDIDEDEGEEEESDLKK